MIVLCIFLYYVTEYMIYKINLGEIIMSSKNYNYSNISRVGNFTKNAVKKFENNIVNQTNYIEKVESNRKEYNNSNNH